jgi:hypothetical protein
VWKVAATVTNPTAGTVDYRVFTSFLDSDNDTRGLLQTDVASVGAGEAKQWAGELELDASDLTCVLRVERTNAS